MNQPPNLSKRILSPYGPALLLNLQCQGYTNNCGPYTTATILNTLCDTDLDGGAVAEEMNEVRWRGIFPVVRRLPNSATFPWGMVDVFLRHDLSASWSFFTPIKELLEMLKGGNILMPIIGSWNPPMAHVMTLIAWDEEDGFGFANTQYPKKDIFWLPAESFTIQWKNMGNLLVRIQHDR
jgi:hypothetical protein